MDRSEAVTVIPGVNYTKRGIIMVDMDLWVRLRVHGMLQLKTIKGQPITIRHSFHDFREDKSNRR